MSEILVTRILNIEFLKSHLDLSKEFFRFIDQDMKIGYILRVGAALPVPPDPGAAVPPEGMVGVRNWLPPLGFLI